MAHGTPKQGQVSLILQTGTVYFMHPKLPMMVKAKIFQIKPQLSFKCVCVIQTNWIQLNYQIWINCQLINSTLRAVLTAAKKNVAGCRFSATFQLFRQLLFRRQPGFLQVFASTLSTTCQCHTCILGCTSNAVHALRRSNSQMFKCSNAQFLTGVIF